VGDPVAILLKQAITSRANSLALQRYGFRHSPIAIPVGAPVMAHRATYELPFPSG
jgi:hypothetical protein